jgi:hypothetical protein
MVRRRQDEPVNIDFTQHNKKEPEPEIRGGAGDGKFMEKLSVVG